MVNNKKFGWNKFGLIITSNLSDSSDAYIHIKGIIAVSNTAAPAAPVYNINKKVIFKNCVLFTSCISEINNTQVDDAQDIAIVMSTYNLIECSHACSKTSESLWQCFRDEPTPDNNNKIINFPANNNNNVLLNFKQQITGQTGNGCTKDFEIIVTLKYLSNFWRTLEMPLINCKISLQLKWSKDCILVAGVAANQELKFEITDTKLHVPVITLSTQDKVKLLKKLQSGFKKTINWNKYQCKKINQA